jgi:5-methylcytosine-specific restriction endonuclease McrA
VKRAVRKRDQDRCTFVGENGHRCESRRFLEYDHAVPIARGGQSTVDNVRIRCRSHNGFEADRVFGSEFMKARREKAQRERVEVSVSLPARRTRPALGGDGSSQISEISLT